MKRKAGQEPAENMKVAKAARNLINRRGRLTTFDIERIFNESNLEKTTTRPNLTSRSRSSSQTSTTPSINEANSQLNKETTDGNAGNNINDGWEYPRKTVKANKKKTNNDMQTDNQFDSLLNAPEIIVDQTQDRHTVNSQNNKSKFKPPPIFINGTDIKGTIDILIANGINKELFTIYVNKTNLTVITKCINAYTTIKNTLKGKTEFYTYTQKDNKPITILLKNIAGNFTEKYISDEITDLQLNQVNIIKIKQLPMKSTQERKHFIVQLTPESILKNLTQVNRLCCQGIRWERLRKPKIIQCTRCQRVGHTASTCEMNYRCVKCGESHPKDECTIQNTDDKSKLKCANCKQFGHPANYQGCTYLKLANNERRHEQNNTRQMRFNNGPPKFNYVQPGRQYSQVISGSQEPSRLPHTPIISNQHQQQPPPSSQTNIQPPAWAIDRKSVV